MAGQTRFGVCAIIWIACQAVWSKRDACHIPNGHSPLAERNKDALRFNFTSLKSMESWKTPSLQIEHQWYQLDLDMGCRVSKNLKVFVVTEFVNTSTSLCSTMTGSAVACYADGLSRSRMCVWGDIRKFGSCDAQYDCPDAWNNYTAIILELSFFFYPDTKTTTYNCSWVASPNMSNILNFTLEKIDFMECGLTSLLLTAELSGFHRATRVTERNSLKCFGLIRCPIGYWGLNCSRPCSCENCHTFTGECLPEPVTTIPPSASTTQTDETRQSLPTTSNTTSSAKNDAFTKSTTARPHSSTGRPTSWSLINSLTALLVFLAK